MTRRRRRPRRRFVLVLDAQTARDLRATARRLSVPPDCVILAALNSRLDRDRRRGDLPER